MGRIFRPFAVGGFTIMPEGEPLPDLRGIPLVLGKKGSFGSGEHETTASCLEILEKLPDLGGMHCLDLGSGTGILAIAAVKCGAAHVVAIDISIDAARSCAANSRLNDCTNRIDCICGELSCISGRFGLVLANIYADIHLALAPAMVALTNPGGLLLLSGIPIQDKFDVQRKFLDRGCELLDMKMLEEYVTLLLRKG